VSEELRLDPDRLGGVPRTGAVESNQAGELDLRSPVSRVINREFLEWAAHTYWRLITRFTLGLIRVVSDERGPCVALVARPLVLLRFHAPQAEIGERFGSVTWRIDRGILVARDGRDHGFLRLSIEALERPHRVRVNMEVRNFYPWLRGSGAFARVGVWIYAQTQQRIHRWVTRAFLRRLGRAAAQGPRSR
jgi:hypothetical protein